MNFMFHKVFSYNQCMVSIVSESSEPSVRVATNADIAEEGIKVPTILFLSSSLRRTT